MAAAHVNFLSPFQNFLFFFSSKWTFLICSPQLTLKHYEGTSWSLLHTVFTHCNDNNKILYCHLQHRYVCDRRFTPFDLEPLHWGRVCAWRFINRNVRWRPRWTPALFWRRLTLVKHGHAVIVGTLCCGCAALLETALGGNVYVRPRNCAFGSADENSGCIHPMWSSRIGSGQKLMKNLPPIY